MLILLRLVFGLFGFVGGAMVLLGLAANAPSLLFNGLINCAFAAGALYLYRIVARSQANPPKG